jgi:MFS family permease
MTIGFLAMAFGSVFWGTVTDRIGPQKVVVTGSVLLAVSLALASFSRSLLEFQLLFGLLVGTATAAIFAPMMATVTSWFDTQRSLAVSLVSAGMGMAPMTMMGTIIGGSAMAGSLGMATGPVLGGWIFDTTAGYGWLYIASFGMGLGAAAIALLFKPFPHTGGTGLSLSN